MSRIIHYEDLTLAIELDGEEAYRVRALNSPYGLAAAPFNLPLCRDELETLFQEISDCLFRCRNAGNSRPARQLLPPEEPWRDSGRELHETGARLFRALFHEALKEIYLLCKGRAESLPDRGLRIRLVLPAETRDSALLQALPWELIYCEQNSDFLARSVLTPVVRQLALCHVSSVLPDTLSARVRILIAVATPLGLSPLDETDERARILHAWCDQQGAEVKLLPHATLSGLYEALRSEHYQVVHFIAHGSFEPETGVGSLLLETPQREPHAVPGGLLAETLRASRELRLVFLNSCESGQVGYQPGQDPLLGVATALVHRGVPAVVAMQFPISDIAARTFSEAVYRSLARGSTLDAAVGDGRLAIHQADTESWEWITPALFTALSGSQVFQPLCSTAEDRSFRGKEVIGQAACLLVAGSHERARQVIEECLEKGPDMADLHYYRALALLGDRRPHLLKVAEFRTIEASARRALQFDDCASHHLCLLAALYQDFYLQNHLVPPKPTYEELLGRAAVSPREPARLAELVRLMPSARAIVNPLARTGTESLS